MVVGKHDMTLYHEYSARFTGRQIAEIRPQVTGKITHISINEGDKVRKGQILFVIDQAPYLAAMRDAIAARKMCEAKLATARMNYNNEVRLKESNVVSDFSVDAMPFARQKPLSHRRKQGKRRPITTWLILQ